MTALQLGDQHHLASIQFSMITNHWTQSQLLRWALFVNLGTVTVSVKGC